MSNEQLRDRLYDELEAIGAQCLAWGSSNDWPLVKKYPQYDAIRSAGRALHDLGGFDELYNAIEHLDRVVPPCGDEFVGTVVGWMWDGIGLWQM